MITVEALSKSYRRPVLENVNATFPSNAISFVLGPNGSGKSTLLACLLGLVRYTGTVRFDGEAIDAARHRIAPVFDDTPFYPHLTGRTNLELLGGTVDTSGTQGATLSEELLDSTVREYSQGQQKRLALMRAQSMGANVILLDEVSSSLDHESVLELRRSLRELAGSATVVTTGHQFAFYEPLIHRLFLLVDGQLIDKGNFPENPASLEEIYEEHFLQSPG